MGLKMKPKSASMLRRALFVAVPLTMIGWGLAAMASVPAGVLAVGLLVWIDLYIDRGKR